jgi:hypothetical protein
LFAVVDDVTALTIRAFLVDEAGDDRLRVCARADGTAVPILLVGRTHEVGAQLVESFARLGVDPDGAAGQRDWTDKKEPQCQTPKRERPKHKRMARHATSAGQPDETKRSI